MFLFRLLFYCICNCKCLVLRVVLLQPDYTYRNSVKPFWTYNPRCASSLYLDYRISIEKTTGEMNAINRLSRACSRMQYVQRYASINNKKQERWSRLDFLFENGCCSTLTSVQRLPNFLFSCKFQPAFPTSRFLIGCPALLYLVCEYHHMNITMLPACRTAPSAAIWTHTRTPATRAVLYAYRVL